MFYEDYLVCVRCSRKLCYSFCRRCSFTLKTDKSVVPYKMKTVRSKKKPKKLIKSCYWAY